MKQTGPGRQKLDMKKFPAAGKAFLSICWPTVQGFQFEMTEVFLSVQDTTDALPCHIHLPVSLWIMDPHSGAPKKNTSHGNKVLQQDSTHLIQRPCYQRGSPRQDQAGNRTIQRPDYRKETQIAVIWSCLPCIRSGQNHLTRHSERGKKTRQTEEEVGRQHQGMDRPEDRQVPEGSGEQEKWRKLVVKSSVVPKRPSWLRDRWWWWYECHFRLWKKAQRYNGCVKGAMSKDVYWLCRKGKADGWEPFVQAARSVLKGVPRWCRKDSVEGCCPVVYKAKGSIEGYVPVV